MAFFKTKQEKEIMAQMARDEQLEVFNDQIKTLQTKREEYARIAAEAEINGDTGTYEVACNALIELNDVISSLMQTKANFDIINISNSIAVSMATAMNALDAMASNKAHLPDIRKIQKANAKVAKYMRRQPSGAVCRSHRVQACRRAGLSFCTFTQGKPSFVLRFT